MQSHGLMHLSLRLVAVWLVLSLLFVSTGTQVLRLLAPLLLWVVDIVQSDFVGTLDVVEVNGEWMIQLKPLTLHPIPLHGGWRLRGGVELGSIGTHVVHTLVPVVLLLTPLLAWPAIRLTEVFLRLALGLPALVATLALTAPILLVGHVQMSIVRAAVSAGAPFHEPFLITFVLFMEGGGRWLLPLALAIGCIALALRLTAGSVMPEAVQRLSPGSGSPLAFPPV